MAKILQLYNDREQLGMGLGLPRLGGSILNWSALPWETLLSWFAWEDDVDNNRLYFIYRPPIDGVLVHYYYMGHIYYDYKLKIQRGYLGKDLEVIGIIKQCQFGIFCGKSSYSEKLIAPKNGIFINQIPMDRFEKGSHTTFLTPGESPFYIDYAFPMPYHFLDEKALEQLRELKRTVELGKCARITLDYLLNNYGISENDL